jgi:hypothetical protein
MVARTVDDVAERLGQLRRDEQRQIALSSVALVASLAATVLYPPLVLPLLLGGIAVGVLGVRSLWRQWDLIDRVADERDAHVIPEVRAYASRESRIERRRASAGVIRLWLGSGLPTDSRILAAAAQLEALARELEDDELELDPACAVACTRLLGDYTASPLLNSTLPRDDVQAWVVRIRAGFRRRS